MHQIHNDRPAEPDSDFVDGLENLAEMLVPESPVFYHVLQCMRNAPLETNKLGPALKRIFGDQHNRIYSALERLSIVQAKDIIGQLSLRYLPDPAARISADTIKSHWEFAVRINNTAPDEDTLVEFLPPISLEHVKRVQSEWLVHKWNHPNESLVPFSPGRYYIPRLYMYRSSCKGR